MMFEVGDEVTWKDVRSLDIFVIVEMMDRYPIGSSKLIRLLKVGGEDRSWLPWIPVDYFRKVS